MAESANSSNLKSALDELNLMIPDQLDGSLEIEETDTMLGCNVVFSLLCNSSQYGAPLFQFFEQCGQLHRYLDIRNEFVSRLLCIAIDVELPTLEYKVKELNRIRKSLQKLSATTDAVSTIRWYFHILALEAGLVTSNREAALALDNNPADYSDSHGIRISNARTLLKTQFQPGSLEYQYGKEMHKLIDTLESMKDNETLLFLLLDDSPFHIYADAGITTTFHTMCQLLTTDEQDYIVDQLGFHPNDDLSINIPEEILEMTKFACPSRFKPDVSFGYRNYNSPENLRPLDWIHADVNTELIRSLASTTFNDNDNSQPATPRHEMMSDSSASQRSSMAKPARRPSVHLASPPPTPPQTVAKASVVYAQTRQPEPRDAGRLGLRSREQQFLLQKEMDKAKRQAQPTYDTEKSDIESEDVSFIVPTKDEAVIHEAAEFAYVISEDSCPQLLAAMIIRFAASLRMGDTTHRSISTLPRHKARFGESVRFAKPVVHTELRRSDYVVALCDSTSSLRYVTTIDFTLKVIFFNRVLHHRWNRWS